MRLYCKEGRFFKPIKIDAFSADDLNNKIVILSIESDQVDARYLQNVSQQFTQMFKAMNVKGASLSILPSAIEIVSFDPKEIKGRSVVVLLRGVEKESPLHNECRVAFKNLLAKYGCSVKVICNEVDFILAEDLHKVHEEAQEILARKEGEGFMSKSEALQLREEIDTAMSAYDAARNQALRALDKALKS